MPAAQVIAFSSALDWSILGAVPEMLQTACGSLTVGLDAQPGQSILIRGGTSSVGMATAVLAKQRGMTVPATTRDPAKASPSAAEAMAGTWATVGAASARPSPRRGRLSGGGLPAPDGVALLPVQLVWCSHG